MGAPVHDVEDMEVVATRWGCWSEAANDGVDDVVDTLNEKIRNDELRTQEAIVSDMAYRLSEVGEGAAELSVRESVAYALKAVMDERGIPELGNMLYGW